jgi:hypothetical protein
MAPEMNFLTAEQVRQYRTNFNPILMTSEYLEEVVSQLNEKPVWYERELSEKPNTHSGMCICRNCRKIDWITPLRDFYGSIKAKGREVQGPFCETCSDDLAKTLLREQS